MKKILLVDNEPLGGDGLIEDAAQFGFSAPLHNVNNLARELSAYGEVSICHYQSLAEVGTNYDYIFLSGRFADWDRARVAEEYAAELDLIRSSKVPLWGICAGHQLIGLAFGEKLFYPGEEKREFGFTRQEIVQHHPMLSGLRELNIFEHHRGQVATVPEGFSLLASTENCRVQMMVHRTRPIVATQFHPELRDEAHQDGKILLDNFFALY